MIDSRLPAPGSRIPTELAGPLAAFRARRADLAFSIEWRELVTSTMDVAEAMAGDTELPTPIVIADAQSAGRGRRGHAWESPAGAGLYMSIVWRRPVAETLPLLTLAAGVGVRDGIAAATGLAPAIKWPNDLLVGRRKLAGLLAEGVGVGGPAQAVIVGIGVNLMAAAYEPAVAARATSLEGELGRGVDRGEVMCEIIGGVLDRLTALAIDPGGILHAWRAASPSAIGSRVEWENNRGVTAGIDETGALLVKTNSGIERIIAGELRWDL